MIRRKRPRRERKTPLAQLKRELWGLFALYVKERDGGVCFTCGAPRLEGKNHHAGHCIRAGGHASTKYDPKNVHAQCFSCNILRDGNTHEYVQRIIDRYGADEYRRMLQKSRETKNWKRPEIEELIAALKRGGADYECAYYAHYL